MKSSPLLYKTAPLSTGESRLHPTLVLLHGRGTDENDLLGLTPYFESRFLIVSVRAPYRFPYGGFTWFNLDESGTIDIDQLLESRNAFLYFLDEIKQKYPVDLSCLCLFGFSMGAMISMMVSLSNPDRFKGVVAHSGMLPQHERLLYRWDDLSAISFFIAHGEYDPVVPVILGRQANQQLIQAGANVLYREYPIQHNIGEESISDAAAWLAKLIS